MLRSVSPVVSDYVRRLFLLVAFAGFATACAPSATPEPDDAAPVIAVVDSSALRPDPKRPVGGNLQTPPGWAVRFDQPSDTLTVGPNDGTDDVFFVSMTPGWHVTTGPAGILYHPASTAGGAFAARATVHLFNPGDRNEGFGLFFGGQGLDTDNQRYDYFLVRNSGDFLIKRRIGSETQLIKDWTPSDAIVRYTDPNVSSVDNTLSVRVSGERVAFSINDREVASLPAADVWTEGVVGLRVNHGLNLHVSDLTVEAGS
jgi:hypothetical protein